MPGRWYKFGFAAALNLSLLLGPVVPASVSAQPSGTTAGVPEDAPAITDLAQLTRELNSQKRLHCSLRLEVVVCSSSSPNHGVIIVKDDTGVELLQLGRRTEQFRAGDKLRLEGARLLLRQRDLGVQISSAPTIDNDGLHPWRVRDGQVALKAGRVPVELDWFNCVRNFGLHVALQPTNGPPQIIPSSAFWHARSEAGANGSTPIVLGQEPGLRAECYEGFWPDVPDFDLLQRVKTGITTNFQLEFRTRDELVGLRFTGFLDAPTNGLYGFRLGSD